jgi:bisphosphoglycerate-independent phosphoglycerate mutase (AlkP superfamily)
MEDLSQRHHTTNPVPALVIGAKALREKFCANLKNIGDVTPAILQFYPPTQPETLTTRQ